MKCERCGCEIKGAPSVISNYDNYGFCIRANHGLESDCIAALKAKLAEKFTSEPMKPDRFATLRLFTRQHHPVYNDVIPELNDLFAAFDEAKVLISNYIYPEFIKWCDKWN